MIAYIIQQFSHVGLPKLYKIIILINKNAWTKHVDFRVMYRQCHYFKFICYFIILLFYRSGKIFYILFKSYYYSNNKHNFLVSYAFWKF